MEPERCSRRARVADDATLGRDGCTQGSVISSQVADGSRQQPRSLRSTSSDAGVSSAAVIALAHEHSRASMGRLTSAVSRAVWNERLGADSSANTGSFGGLSRSDIGILDSLTN
jgi:hypothetical protein